MLDRIPPREGTAWRFRAHPKGWMSFSEYDGGNGLDIAGQWLSGYRSEHPKGPWGEDWDRIAAWETIRAVCVAACRVKLPYQIQFMSRSHDARRLAIFFCQTNPDPRVEVLIQNTTSTQMSVQVHLKIPSWSHQRHRLDGLDDIPGISEWVESELRAYLGKGGGD